MLTLRKPFRAVSINLYSLSLVLLIAALVAVSVGYSREKRRADAALAVAGFERLHREELASRLSMIERGVLLPKGTRDAARELMKRGELAE